MDFENSCNPVQSLILGDPNQNHKCVWLVHDQNEFLGVPLKKRQALILDQRDDRLPHPNILSNEDGLLDLKYPVLIDVFWNAFQALSHGWGLGWRCDSKSSIEFFVLQFD